MRQINVTDKDGTRHRTNVYDSEDSARALNDGVHATIKTEEGNIHDDPATGWMNWNPRGFQNDEHKRN